MGIVVKNAIFSMIVASKILCKKENPYFRQERYINLLRMTKLLLITQHSLKNRNFEDSISTSSFNGLFECEWDA